MFGNVARLALPRAAAAVIGDARRRQRRRRIALSCVLIAAGVAVYLGVERGGSPSGASTGHSGFSVTRFRLDAGPVAVDLANGSIWALLQGHGGRAELVRLDPRSGRRLASFTIGRGQPGMGGIAVGHGFVWAASGDHAIRVALTGTGDVGRVRVPGVVTTITLGDGSAWIASIGEREDVITRIDATTLAPQARIPVTPPFALGALGLTWRQGALWRIEVGNPFALAVSRGRVWISEHRLLVAYDARGRARAQIRLPFEPGAIAVAGSYVWVTNDCGCRAGKVALVDARTKRVVAVHAIGVTPISVAAVGRRAWVATYGDDSLSRVTWSR